MFENTSAILGTAGAIAGIIASAISVLTYRESKNAKRKANNNIKNNTHSNSEAVEDASEKIELELELEAISYEKSDSRLWASLVLIWLVATIASFSKSSSPKEAIALSFGVAAILMFTVRLPFGLYWRYRAKKIIRAIKISEAESFFEKHKWKDKEIEAIVKGLIRREMRRRRRPW